MMTSSFFGKKTIQDSSKNNLGEALKKVFLLVFVALRGHLCSGWNNAAFEIMPIGECPFGKKTWCLFCNSPSCLISLFDQPFCVLKEPMFMGWFNLEFFQWGTDRKVPQETNTVQIASENYIKERPDNRKSTDKHFVRQRTQTRA